MGWQRYRVTRGTVTFLLCVAFCLASSAGCFGSKRGRSGLMVEAGVTEISAAELRIRMRGLAAPFSGMFEEAADAIIAGTSDYALQQEILLWKINVIPSMQSAIFHPDPLAALFDTWALILQVRNRVDVRREVDLPEEVWAIVRKTLDTMEREIEELASLASSDGTAARLKDDVEVWVAKNPISTSVITRPPLGSQLAAFNADTKVGIRKTAGMLNEGMMDVAARVDIYNSYLPKQARWQAEYLVGQIVRGDEIGGALAELTRLTGMFEELSVAVDEMPDRLAGEREAILKAVEAERIALLRSIEQDLMKAVSAEINKQRDAFSSDLNDQVLLLVQALDDETATLAEVLQQERIESMLEMERIISKNADLTIRDLVDYFFLKTVQLLAVIFALITILALILRFLLFRPHKEERI